MRRQFPIFTLFSVALYILTMSIHIAAQQGEIADKILLPGDPLRAKFIAENFLEDAVCFNEVRNMFGYTGTYKGHRVSVMGVVGTYCALIYPVFDPYEFPHITGFSFLIGHYALLVNSLNVIFNSFKTHPTSQRLIVVATLLLNLALVIVNQTIGGNYGMLKHTPFIMGTPLFVKYLAVSGALIILMIIMKKGLEHFEDKY